MIRARTATAAATAVLALALIALTVGPASSAERAPAQTLGSKCGVFPVPGSDVAADAASLPDQRAWNQDISKAPVDPASDRIIDFINQGGDPGLHPDFGSPREYGIPFRVVGKKTPRTKVRFTAYGDESDKGKYRIPLKTPIEGGANADGDRHVIAYDKDRCKLYELYRAFPKGKRWNADSGAIWDLTNPGLRTEGWTSADAAGLPIFPGLVRYDEVKSGAVNHAIRLTFDVTRDAWINPASHCAGSTNDADAPPMGMRLRLKAGYDTSQIDGDALVIANALKRYGFIVADNGSDWYFSGATDRRWNDDDLNQLKEIPGGAFEVVRSQAETHVC